MQQQDTNILKDITKSQDLNISEKLHQKDDLAGVTSLVLCRSGWQKVEQWRCDHDEEGGLRKKVIFVSPTEWRGARRSSSNRFSKRCQQSQNDVFFFLKV